MNSKQETQKSSSIFTKMKKLLISDNFIKEEVLPQTSLKSTFKFFFAWNALLGFFVSILVTILLFQKVENFRLTTWNNTVPDFEFSIKNGEFSTNLETPYVITTKDSKSDFLRIDLSDDAKLDKLLVKITQGVLITKKQLFIRDYYSTSNFKFTDLLPVSKLDTNKNEKISREFQLSKKEINTYYQDHKLKIFSYYFLANFIIMVLFLSPLVLLYALFWGIVFWSIGGLFGIKNWTFKKSYSSIIYFILLPIWFLIMIQFWFNTTVPFFTFVVLLILFYLNFSAIKKTQSKT